jgi:hypothetical protein
MKNVLRWYEAMATAIDAAWQRLFGLPAMVPVAVAGSAMAEGVRAAKEAERLAGVRGAARINDEWFEGRPKPNGVPPIPDMKAEFDAGVAKLQAHVDRVYAHVMQHSPSEMMEMVDSVTRQWEYGRDQLERANLSSLLNSSGQVKALAARDLLNSMTMLGMADVIRRYRESRQKGGAT